MPDVSRYYVVYEFEKYGGRGKGASTGVLMPSQGPSSADVHHIAEQFRERYDYDKVMVCSWQKLSDEVDLEQLESSEDEVDSSDEC